MDHDSDVANSVPAFLAQLAQGESGVLLVTDVGPDAIGGRFGPESRRHGLDSLPPPRTKRAFSPFLWSESEVKPVDFDKLCAQKGNQGARGSPPFLRPRMHFPGSEPPASLSNDNLLADAAP